MSTMRSHYCGDLRESHIDQEITVVGWVHRRRDHGGVIFVDLRDHTGLLQVVFDPDREDIFKLAESLRSEFVIQVTARVRNRPEGTVNKKMPTGAVEVLGLDLKVLNRSETPALQIEGYQEVGEETRLKYRYLDLRRPEMQNNLRLRAQVTRTMRRYLDDQDFLDIETPMLTKATPEGARDYLVPSRTHAGKFFALPQSPQLFKQLLMVSGFDRYYQIVKCFRDEDLRADRQPEFTQVDIETAFLTDKEVMALAEGMIRALFTEVLKIDLGEFPTMPYAEAMHDYGSDKPDLRIPIKLIEISDLLKDVEFKVFAGPANDPKSRIAAMRVEGAGELSRKKIDEYTKFVGRYGARGLAYIKCNDIAAGREGLQSPILKFLPDEAIAGILERTGAQTGDIVFFGADKKTVVNDALGALRVKVGHDMNLLTSEWAPLWVVDFPMFEYDDKEKRLNAIHHPFTAPACSAEELKANPETALSIAYDMVLNGTELGGGSVRIYQPEMQDTVFELLGISKEEAEEKFGFLLDALKFGAPPHAGLAFGLDRLIMLMTGASSIRDVMAFPKTQSAACPLTNAPGDADRAQLKELSIQVRKPVVAETATEA